MDNQNLTREDVFGGKEFLPRLVEELDNLYPQVTPTHHDSLQQIMYKSGQRSVVDYLKSKLET